MASETSRQLGFPCSAGQQNLLPEGCGVVYFGNDWFAENRTSSHHIARRLSQKVPFLYVEVPGLRAPTASRRDLRKIWRKLRRAAQPPQLTAERTWVMTLPQLPFRRLPLVGKLNQIYGQFKIKRAMRQLGFRDPILWFVVPHPGPLAGRLGERYVVYYCIDDYAGLPDVDQLHVARLDDDLTRSADQVFVAATSLLEKKKRLNPNTFLSPHGVDFHHFNRAMQPDTPLADLAKGLTHPVIGYFGNVGGWTDIELLVHLAKSRPDWTLLFVGFVSVDVTELQKCPNVVFAGAQPYEKLPEWAKAFDVAILPYSLNRGSINANPLKLREYLATGKPVVAVSTPEVERFSHCVRIAHSRDEFLQKIEEALTQDSEEELRKRLDAVRDCTWDARADEVLKTVLAGMSERLACRPAVAELEPLNG